jgi:parallel beta-helix repeat protein
MANPGDMVTIDGGSDPRGLDSIVQLTDVHYFVVSGFIIDGLGLASRCVGIEAPSTGIRVEYNEIKGSALNAVLIGATGAELVGNYIHDGGYYGGSDPPYGYGLYLGSSDNLIEGNEVYNMGGFGMHLYTQEQGALHDNIIIGNQIHHNNQAYGGGGAGIILGGQNNLVYNNLIYDENYGIRVDYSDPENNRIVSNTIQNVAGYCLMIGADSSAQGTILMDNTLDGCGYGPIYPFGTEY